MGYQCVTCKIWIDQAPHLVHVCTGRPLPRLIPVAPAYNPPVAVAPVGAARTPTELVGKRFNVALPSLQCAPGAVQPTASALLTSCFASDADANAAIRGQLARVRELLSYISGSVPARLLHLEKLNINLCATQKIWKLAPKKLDIAIDNEFVNLIDALSVPQKTNLFQFLNRKPAAHTAIDKLREYVFSNGQEMRGAALTNALILIGKVGSLQDAAISKGLIHGWIRAHTQCVENSAVMPAVAMTAPVLRQHYEKHCCNMHGNNRPEEAAWWATHLKYTLKVQDLRDAGIVLTQRDIAELCPNGGENITSAYQTQLFFTRYGRQELADVLSAAYMGLYSAFVQNQFIHADKAFVRFEGGKIQVAARKGLYFMMATYNPQAGNAYTLDLMSAYFPDDLQAHWLRLQGDLIWWIKS